MIDDDYESAGYEATNHSPPGEIRHGVRQLARDVVSLVELQSELLQVELRTWVRTCVVPAAVLVAIAAIIALASLPIMLLSLAHYLVEAADWPLAGALLAAGGGAIGLALVTVLAAWVILRRGAGAFERFRVELRQNIQWLKQVLGRPLETAEQVETTEAVRWPPR
jgi:hypothetical protein